MRALALLLLFAACSEAEPIRDAGVPDAGADAGVDGGTVACGEAICPSDQFCEETPNGACAPSDGGICAETEEVCQLEGAAGCTPKLTRACTSFPAACASTHRCACLLAGTTPCASGARFECRQDPGQGLVVTCPFP